MIPLHKILETDKERIIRFCLAEDPDLIAIFKSGEGNDLDASVNGQLSLITKGSSIFKVESDSGAVVGYFVYVPVVVQLWQLQGFIIRKTFRTADYQNAFFDLIRSTFENNLSFSTSDKNYLQPNNITNNITISNPAFFSNKNYVLLKTYNTQ